MCVREREIVYKCVYVCVRLCVHVCKRASDYFIFQFSPKFKGIKALTSVSSGKGKSWEF